MKIMHLVLSASFLLPANSFAMRQNVHQQEAIIKHTEEVRFSAAMKILAVLGIATVAAQGLLIHLEHVKIAYDKGYQAGLSTSNYNRFIEGIQDAQQAYLNGYNLGLKKECNEQRTKSFSNFYDEGRKAAKNRCELKKKKKKRK